MTAAVALRRRHREASALQHRHSSTLTRFEPENKGHSRMKTVNVAIVAAVIALTAGAAFAQQKGSGVSIGGNVNQNTNVQGAVTTVNTGKEGKASTEIGAIKGDVKIGGNVNQNTNVQGAVTTVNTGKSGCASTSIGSISSNPGC